MIRGCGSFRLESLQTSGAQVREESPGIAAATPRRKWVPIQLGKQARAVIRLAATLLAAIIALEPVAVGARTPDYVSSIRAEDTGLKAEDSNGVSHDLYTQSHALLIGQSQYAHWPRLRLRPEIDALRAALEENNFKVEVHHDLGAEDLLRVVNTFVRSRGAIRNARIFVYFGGHGWTRDVETTPMGFLIPVDAPLPGPDQNSQRFLEMALPMTLFEAYARVPDARHMLFVFDSCFSGSIFGNRGVTPDLRIEVRGREDRVEARPASYVFSQRTTLRPARQFFAAGSAGQTVPEKSVFTDLMTQVLRGERPEADGNRDGFVTGHELDVYLTRAVVEAHNDPNRQNPRAGYVNDRLFNIGDFIFRPPSDGHPQGGQALAAPLPATPRVSEFRAAQVLSPARPSQLISLSSIPPRTVAPQGGLDTAQRSRLAGIVERLTSPDEQQRRGARVQLSRFLAEIGTEPSASVSADLVRGLANSSYRYQLGVAVALASLRRQGWTSSEPETTARLLDSALSSPVGRDATLRRNLEDARRGLRM
jgi:hypothetical protein